MSNFCDINCLVCGRPVEQKKGRGRTRDYHPGCKKYAQIVGWLEDILTGIEVATVEDQRKIRSELWRLANLMNEKKVVKNDF